MTDYLNLAPVSVVIPCFKASAFLERAVDSVLNQTLRPAELILIDDASPDEGKTRQLITYLVDKVNKMDIGVVAIPVFLKKNSGPGGARNAGWENASQDWVAFLDADDAWALDKIALQYGCIKADHRIDLLAHGSSLLCGDRVKPPKQGFVVNPSLKRLHLFNMLFCNSIPTRSVMLRREIPLRFPKNTLSEDYSLWLRIIAAGYDVQMINCSLAFTFRSEYSIGGSSGQLWRQEKGELRALFSLHKAGGVNFMTMLIACGWSVVKFIRRIIIRTLGKLTSQRQMINKVNE